MIARCAETRTATGSGDLMNLRDSRQKSPVGGGVSCRYLVDGLPPSECAARLRFELQLVPTGQRAEALQVAWEAHLEGRSAARAVNTWWRLELRRRQRELTVGTDLRCHVDPRYHDSGCDQGGGDDAGEGVERDRLV